MLTPNNMFYPLSLVIFFSVYPIMVIGVHNIEEMILTDIFFPLFLSLVSYVATFFLIDKILKNRNKSALITAVLIIFFFYYGHIFYEYISGKHLFEITIGRHRFFLPVWTIFFSLIIFYLYRSQKDFTNLVKFFSSLSIFLVLTSLATFFLNSEETNSQFQKKFDTKTSSYSSTKVEKLRYPDIYYIILDGYASKDTLFDIYKFDNSYFYKSLMEKGFYIAEDAKANHSFTYLSLSSSLNMAYMNWLADHKKPANFKDIGNYISNNLVAKKLKQLGYKYINFDSSYNPSRKSSIADKTITCNNINELDRTILKTTLISPFLLYGDIREGLLCQFEKLSDVDPSSPKFVFNHIIAPHPPFVFKSNGDAASINRGLNPWADKDAYIEQLKFINSKLIESVDSIISKSPGSIVIVQSDHGPASSGTEEMLNPSDTLIKERMGILSAFYFGNNEITSKLYKSISPVNSFRLIFSEIFNEKIDLLDDKSYFTPIDGKAPKIFDDVTHILR